MKKVLVSMMFFVCILQFTACSGTTEGNIDEVQMAEREDMADVESEKPDNTARYEAYRNALILLIDNRIFPDGTEADYEEGSQFAVCDIDGDGREELLISYMANTMAGMALQIYDYDDAAGRIYEQIWDFPFAAFYNNNMIKIDASHNHGNSAMEDFWPYSLYQYDMEADKYQRITSVDAWQKEFFAEGFPAEKDEDHNGIVYSLTDDDGEKSYLDDTEYQAWINGYLGTAEAVQIDWRSLEKSSIGAVLQTSQPDA